MTIDSSVKAVRSFLRVRPAQMSGRYFMASSPNPDERVIFERLMFTRGGRHQPSCPCRRASCRDGEVGGLLVVRDHDDGLAVLPAQRPQQIENLVGGLAIEVAGRLVADQERRVGHQRAGDGDALLLAARELGRLVARAVREADDLQRRMRLGSRRSAAKAATAAAAARRWRQALRAGIRL